MLHEAFHKLVVSDNESEEALLKPSSDESSSEGANPSKESIVSYDNTASVSGATELHPSSTPPTSMASSEHLHRDHQSEYSQDLSRNSSTSSRRTKKLPIADEFQRMPPSPVAEEEAEKYRLSGFLRSDSDVDVTDKVIVPSDPPPPVPQIPAHHHEQNEQYRQKKLQQPKPRHIAQQMNPRALHQMAEEQQQQQQQYEQEEHPRSDSALQEYEDRFYNNATPRASEQQTSPRFPSIPGEHSQQDLSKFKFLDPHAQMSFLSDGSTSALASPVMSPAPPTPDLSPSNDESSSGSDSTLSFDQYPEISSTGTIEEPEPRRKDITDLMYHTRNALYHGDHPYFPVPKVATHHPAINSNGSIEDIPYKRKEVSRLCGVPENSDQLPGRYAFPRIDSDGEVHQMQPRHKDISKVIDTR